MTQQGYEDYLLAVFDSTNGTVKSYITALHIIDELFKQNDVYSLSGKSITCIEDKALLEEIAKYIREQQKLYIKGEESFFDNVNSDQKSYPGKRFCSAAMKQLLLYNKYDDVVKEADRITTEKKKGNAVCKELLKLFKLEKEGKDSVVTTKRRLGQEYFRKMILANYGGKCCVTGLNIPQTLRASHIVAWAEDQRYRMNPENGLCLSATYDAAFDKHLISFDEDYRMIVSKDIKSYYTNDVAKEYFQAFEGKQMIMPELYKPSQKLLDRHRSLMK